MAHTGGEGAPRAPTNRASDRKPRPANPDGGVRTLGPGREAGRHAAPSNEAFDRQLRSSNPDWGVRDLEAVAEVAVSHGLALRDVIAMPANNLSVMFRPVDIS